MTNAATPIRLVVYTIRIAEKDIGVGVSLIPAG